VRPIDADAWGVGCAGRPFLQTPNATFVDAELGVDPSSVDQLGSSTVSITWMTPFD
jgi:hypothetical protein